MRRTYAVESIREVLLLVGEWGAAQQDLVVGEPNAQDLDAAARRLKASLARPSS